MPFLATVEGQFAFGKPTTTLTQITTSSLQIWIDAASNASYPGSGTTWNNLVTANAATYWYNLSNGPPAVSTIVFNNTSNISLFFDGTNDYATPNVSLQTLAEVNNWNETREYWLFWPGAPGCLTMESGAATPDTNWFDAQASVSNASLAFSVWQGNVNMTAFVVTNSLASNAWNHIIWQHSKSSNLLMGYVNGVQLYSNASVPRTTSPSGFFPILMAGSATNYGYGSGAYLRGSLGVYRWYNQLISGAQISSNYNAERGRFGR